MKIKKVIIDSLQYVYEPDSGTFSSADWWDHVKAAQDEPLIEATIEMTLSWREYEELLKKGREYDFS